MFTVNEVYLNVNNWQLFRYKGITEFNFINEVLYTFEGIEDYNRMYYYTNKECIRKFGRTYLHVC